MVGIPADGVLPAAALAVHLGVVHLEVNGLQRERHADVWRSARRRERERESWQMLGGRRGCLRLPGLVFFGHRS